jgi:adenine-specific DNA methylase
MELRAALLDFIADFSDWNLAHDRDYLEVSRSLVQIAHECLGGEPGTNPLVVDSFAGGGAIPLEAMRVGADAFASDLNPVAVLLNKVVLELVPVYGDKLIDGIREWGHWVREQAENELARFYPRDSDRSTPIAYLWARTVRCEGPGCGAEVPLIRGLRLGKKAGKYVGLGLIVDRKKRRIDFEIVDGPKGGDEGTVRRGSATCPICGYTTVVERIRAQLREQHGGARNARLVCVVTTHPSRTGRGYRIPGKTDLAAIRDGLSQLTENEKSNRGKYSLVPDEPLPPEGTLGFRVQKYGVLTWGDLFSPRQALMLSTFVSCVRRARVELVKKGDVGLANAIATCLALAVDRLAEHSTSICRWNSSGEKVQASFGRQAVPIVWDFCEAQPFGGSVGDWEALVKCVVDGCRAAGASPTHGSAERVSAAKHPLPDDVAQAFVSDPPYYDAVPYADLSDFFYVWLRRSIGDLYPSLFASSLTPKGGECVVNPMAGSDDGPVKDSDYFERTMMEAMKEGRRITRPDGVGVVVFAHKSTSGWEAQLQAMIDAGWRITASWPIDTEMGSRLRAQNSSALASSIHLVCRPRENPDGSLRSDAVGDWRDVLDELPKRIHAWLPRLATEGVVGADAIFACLGPALEIFSRHSRVERASGAAVTLKEYLEHVWAAVAKEALTQVFHGADTAGFEEDARLTAMWLWTLSIGGSSGNGVGEAEEAESGEDEEEESPANSKIGGFVLEYDAARKIAQGLGAHLESLSTLIEVKGSIARLLPVAERTRALFQKGETATSVGRGKSKKKGSQLSMGFVADIEEAEESGGWGDTGAPHKGETVLDRVHQAMILFGAGRGEALKRFLVDDGVGRDGRFWRLAQAFSALYPASTDEKRWVDGVLARKKGLGF